MIFVKVRTSQDFVPLRTYFIIKTKHINKQWEQEISTIQNKRMKVLIRIYQKLT